MGNKQTKDKPTKKQQTTRDAQLQTDEQLLIEDTPLVVSATDGAATAKETQPLQVSDLDQSEVSTLWYELGYPLCLTCVVAARVQESGVLVNVSILRI